jgi:UDP-N-acetyl-D-galactosamine dehydrogenase
MYLLYCNRSYSVDKNNRPNLTPLYKSSETVGSVLKGILLFMNLLYIPRNWRRMCSRFRTGFRTAIQCWFFCRFLLAIIRATKNIRLKNFKNHVWFYTRNRTRSWCIISIGYYCGNAFGTSIKVAEAAKVIENSQRDINIAFVNELAKIFNLMQIDTSRFSSSNQMEFYL